MTRALNVVRVFVTWNYVNSSRKFPDLAINQDRESLMIVARKWSSILPQSVALKNSFLPHSVSALSLNAVLYMRFRKRKLYWSNKLIIIFFEGRKRRSSNVIRPLRRYPEYSTTLRDPSTDLAISRVFSSLTIHNHRGERHIISGCRFEIGKKLFVPTTPLKGTGQKYVPRRSTCLVLPFSSVIFNVRCVRNAIDLFELYRAKKKSSDRCHTLECSA